MYGKRCGFTLIELLVVIAIIAILAAILFPIFVGAKATSQRSACLSNLRQLGSAAHMYADNWNDYYPDTRTENWPFGDWNDRPPWGSTKLGPRLLMPYVKNNQVFFCRSNKYFKSPPYWQLGAYWFAYCYWANYLRIDPATGKPILSRKEVAVKAGEYPYSLIFSDIIITGNDGKGNPLEWNSHITKEPLGGNLLYNDGHAKWKHFNQMKKLVTISPGAGHPSPTFYW